MTPHGTKSRYTHGGCRCDECRAAAVLAEKRRRVDRARGRVALVDATAARTHLQWLSDCGVGQHAVADATGITPAHVVRIKTGRVDKVRVSTEARILAVHLGNARRYAPVRNLRVFAMVDELKAHGWTERELARRLGYAGTSGLQLNRRTMRVTPAKAERIAALHRELMAPIVARREHEAQRRARQRRALAEQRGAA